jgi:hypothetical protein
MTKLILIAGLVGGIMTGASIASAQEEGQVRKAIEGWISSVPSLWPAGEMKDRRGTIAIRLSGEGGGVWHLGLADGKIMAAPGDLENPTAVIESAASDWVAILRGELQPQSAFFSGKLRLSGDLSFATEVYSRLQAQAAGGGNVTTDVSAWYRFDSSPMDYSKASAADASDLLDAPAGKHGFLTVRGDRFVFEDGTPARFWGTVVAGGPVFMDHEAAERAAARLARFGCNMVRLHHMDADWARPNIFDSAYDDTQHFSAESLDRLDYLIYQLKQRGVYVYLDLLVHRKFKAGDGVRDWQQVANGAKIVAHFNPQIIELQKKYAHELYTHLNKYTGLRYCDDPAIAMSEIINESSLFWLSGYDAVPPSYIAELNDLWRAWAKSHQVTTQGEVSVTDGLRQRNPKVLGFLYETQVAYFNTMRDYLRSIGVKVPIAGSNHWEATALDLKSNLAMDYVDRHSYWDHPQGGFGPGASFDNVPMVKSKSWDMASWMAGQRAAGKPFIVTEWNCCWINEYIAEGPLTMAAYGAFQGWDGLLQFDYSGADWLDHIEGNFDIGNKPHVFATWPAAARLFLKGQVEPGSAAVETRYRPDTADTIAGGLRERAGLRYRLSFAFAGPGEAEALPDLAKLEGPAVSDTGQLTWDAEAGLITIDAPACAARIGFANGPVKAGPVSFEVIPGFAVTAVTALDDRPIPQSGRLLITAAARAENSGMVYGPGKTKALDAGRAPLLVEPVRGKVQLAVEQPLTAVEVYPLDSVGRRQGLLVAGKDDGTVTIPLVANSLWYEVVISR